MSVKAPLIAVLLCISTAAIGQDATQIQRYLENLKTGSICQRRAAISGLHRMGKAAIPRLIEHIDDHEVAPSSTLMLANPLLSSAPASQKNEFSGVINAYVVELILASATLRDEKDCTFLLSERDYVYGWGVIMKDGEVISAADLARVKQQYVQWWGKNQSKSLSTLRGEWKERIRPLTGSEYHWR